MARDINRHRGLSDGELPRRWLRRHEQAHPDDLESRADDADDYVYDDYWSPYDIASPFDFLMHRLSTDLLWASTPRVPWSDGAPEPPPSIAAVDLPDALFEHIQRLQSPEAERAYLRGEWARRARIDLAVARERAPALARWCAERPAPAFMMLLLGPFWIRRPHEWTPPASDDVDELGRALVEHLLVRYPVPVALYGPWRSAWPKLKWVLWLVVLGQGGSMKRAAARFGWSIVGAFVHELGQIAPGLDITEAVITAEIRRLGGNATDCARILNAPAYRTDPTSGTAALLDVDDEALPEHTVEFWRATVSWLIRHRDQLTDEHAAYILNWAMHRHTEDVARQAPAAERFSWRGRTPTASLAVAREYAWAFAREYAQQHVARPNLRWRPRGWDWEAQAEAPTWSMHELTTSEELAAETIAMRHCVWSYDYKCAQGRAAIFSLRFGGARRVTVEIEPHARRVVQARGVSNCACTDDEMRVIERWLAQLGPA